ncbi:polysaccharide biosynthesis tyrosine autokinase [Novosphingobium sp.]|uniref:GumC family protein n=1 Tax=Novosphingobium sp. TaxID=1874826 RepID=UPI002B48D611|nr:polysaccharide biosynthesis tyrosine autokinase [Novosphingobium sp.]HKR92178.1 polysaccharide biosynthesis tyrosine autokinase [Novosphingobium sp.]
MNQVTVAQRDVEEQDLAGIYSRFRRHLPISIAIIVATGALAVGVTQLMPVKYTATARMSYDRQQTVVGQTQPVTTMSDAQRDAAVEAQMQLVQSLAVAQTTIDSLGLAKDPELTKIASQFAEGPSQDALAAALLTNVNASRIGQTELFNISYTDKDPLKAAKIANALADAYLKIQSKQKVDLASASSGELAKRVDDARKDAEQADAAVAAYRLKHNVLNSTDSDALEQQVGTMTTDLAQARSEAAQNGARRGATELTNGVDTSALATLRQRHAEAQQEVTGLAALYGDRHPDLVAARQRLATIDQALVQETSRVANGSSTEANAAAARAASLGSSLSQARATLAGNVRASVDLADLQRKADTAHQLYQNLLSVSGEQSANQALIQPDARLTAAATPPLQPSSPRLAINILVGLALGIAIAVALAYLRERWNRRINTIDDISELLGQNFLNSLPTLKSSIDKPKTEIPTDAVLEHPMSSFAEAFRSLATTLIYDARSNNPRTKGVVIGLSSALPGEGKTTSAVSMARVLGMGGTKVALLDFDLRRRSLTQEMAPSATVGWTEVVQGEATMEEAAVPDRSGVTIFPAVRGAHEVQRVYEGEGFNNFMNRLRSEYEVIVIDTAPVLAVVDVRNMLSSLDTLALMARWRSTPIKAIRAALHQIETVGGSVAGVAMTLVNLKTQAQSGYGDASYYYNEIKDYYAQS